MDYNNSTALNSHPQPAGTIQETINYLQELVNKLDHQERRLSHIGYSSEDPSFQLIDLPAVQELRPDWWTIQHDRMLFHYWVEDLIHLPCIKDCVILSIVVPTLEWKIIPRVLLPSHISIPEHMEDRYWRRFSYSWMSVRLEDLLARGMYRGFRECIENSLDSDSKDTPLPDFAYDIKVDRFIVSGDEAVLTKCDFGFCWYCGVKHRPYEIWVMLHDDKDSTKSPICGGCGLYGGGNHTLWRYTRWLDLEGKNDSRFNTALREWTRASAEMASMNRFSVSEAKKTLDRCEVALARHELCRWVTMSKAEFNGWYKRIQKDERDLCRGPMKRKTLRKCFGVKILEII